MTVCTKPEITIEDIFVVVVDRLHHLVAAPEGASEAGDRRFALITIQCGLKVKVKRPRTEPAPVHWAEHLYLANRIEAESCRNAVVHELDDFARGVVGLSGLRPNRSPIAPLDWLFNSGIWPLVDAMSIDHDAALRRLTKNLGQTRDRHYRRVYDICQHLRPDHREQLVRVTYQQKSRSGR